jgi:hypothetical protein
MKFLLAALVFVAGAWAQDTYNCPDGWLLEVGLGDFDLSSSYISNL